MEKNFFLLFAVLSSPRSISKCGKITSGQVSFVLWPEFLQYFLLWAGLIMTQIHERVHGGFYQGRIDPPEAGRGHATPIEPVQRRNAGGY